MENLKRTSESENITKKIKILNSNNYFYKTLEESGLILKYPEKCIAAHEAIKVIRNIKKALEKHFDYPRNVSEFYTYLAKNCDNIDVFRHYLYPNVVIANGENGDEVQCKHSVIKILLSVPILQSKLIDYILNKAIDFTAESNCQQWIQIILKCLSSLDNIVDGDKITTQLLDLLDITSEKSVCLEIIICIPDIIISQHHDKVAEVLTQMLSRDRDLIPAILDCLSYMSLSDEQYESIQKKTLYIFSTLSKCSVFVNFVKFLLIPGRDEDTYLEAVQGLRDGLVWCTTVVSPQEIASSQVITATAIRNSMLYSKVISGAWLKVISNCKVYTDHKPIDFIILLILYSTIDQNKKQVESIIKKQIKLQILRDQLLDDAFDKFKPILKEYLQNLIRLANYLLNTQNDHLIESFSIHIYTLMFANLDDCCQTIIAALLQLSLYSKQSLLKILHILNSVASNDISLLKRQGVQMSTLLNRLDDMSISEIKAVMNILCNLAYSYDNSSLRDKIHMNILKELRSFDPRMQIQGILAGVHAIKYLMVNIEEDTEIREMPDSISYGSTSLLPEGSPRDAGQIVELIIKNTKQFPEMVSFFYDELSEIISSASHVNESFLSWLTHVVTNDLKEIYIENVIKNEYVGNIKLITDYCLDSDTTTDEVVLINIAGLTLQQMETEMCIDNLSPHFQLVQILYAKDDNIPDIDALLGFPIVMPKFDIDTIEDMDLLSITKILDCLFHANNWFRELLNAFSLQNDENYKSKCLKRLQQIQEVQTIIEEILLKTKISYKTPNYTLKIDKYFSELSTEKKTSVKLQGSKRKVLKKGIHDETILPETVRTQGTQNISLKGTLNVVHNINFRPLNLNILNMLNNGLSEDREADGKLNVRTLTFLLKCINSKLENVLVSKIKKKTFISKQEYVVYDPKNGQDSAKAVNEILHEIMTHLEVITLQIEQYSSENLPNETSNDMYTSDILDYLSCLENIYEMFTIYFKWIEFSSDTTDRNELFEASLRIISKSEDTSIKSEDLLIAVVENFQNHIKCCLQISTVISLMNFLKTIQSYTNNRNIVKKLRKMAQNFLSQQWKTPEKILEKGSVFNQSIDCLTSIFLMNSEISELKKIVLQLTHDIELLKSRNGSLNCLKVITRSNFPILYRNIGLSLNEAIKTNLNKRLTNSEHIALWNEVVIILKYMSDLAKSLGNRNNLFSFFKKTLPVIKLFLSHGVPIIGLQFKYETDNILEILKTLQISTRFLQGLCCHSKIKEDKLLMNNVPYARQLLETLIYKVKSILVANNCLEAFWIGSLKNKNIDGEVIISQTSVDEESIDDDDCEDQLPEDDESDEAYEMLNPDSKSVSDIF